MSKKKSEQAKKTVTLFYKGEHSKEEEEILDFEVEPARVSMSMGMTVNLGNYESARLDVSVSLPCYREEVEYAYAHAREWVEEKITLETEMIKKFQDSAKKAKEDNKYPF